MTTSHPTSASTSSGQTASYTRFKHTVALGRRLVRELELERDGDTLGKWMAHYIAELITKAESAQTEADRDEARKECADTILGLWSHRSSMPGKKQPLVSFDPILRTLNDLDTDSRYRYFTPSDKVENQWMEIAEGVDRSARTLIDLSVRLALIEASEQEAEWMDLAKRAVKDNDQQLNLLLSLRERAEAISAQSNGFQDDGKPALLAIKQQLDAFLETSRAFSDLIDEMLDE